MTQGEFDVVAFSEEMKAEYNDEEYWVASVNFDERLLALASHYGEDADEWLWVRCENCELL